MLANSKNGVSFWEISRSIGVTQKTAWFMLQRGGLVMQDEAHGGKIGGEGSALRGRVNLSRAGEDLKVLASRLYEPGPPAFAHGQISQFLRRLKYI